MVAIQSHRTASKVNYSLKVKCYLIGFLQQIPILELYQLGELLKTSANDPVDIEVNLYILGLLVYIQTLPLPDALIISQRYSSSSVGIFINIMHQVLFCIM